MTKQNKAFQLRLLPNKDQEIFFAKTLGSVHFVYHKMLTERKETYEKYKDDKGGYSITTICSEALDFLFSLV